MKHTKGPWKIRKGFDGDLEIYKPNKAIKKPFEPTELAVVKFNGTSKQTKANARLIAAAPDLLEAIHGLLNALPSATTYPAIQAARKAIKKAEGGGE